MSDVKKIILIGAGCRGRCYTDTTLKMPENYKVIAVAEPQDDCRQYIKETHGLSDDMCFTTWEPLLELGKIADIAIIATMDRQHTEPTLKAIELGYDILLEKPVAPTPEECRLIQRAAEKRGVKVLVCHVLRYTHFFNALKDIIDSGDIGRVMNIQHIEAVGNVHHSHSFTRGNWRNSEESTPMILQKTCHDMDIMAWLVGKKCKKVQSFGKLSHFTAENAPADAPEYCIDGCPHADECPYNAVKIYYDDKENNWFRTTCTKMAKPTDEDVERAIRTTDYGKCVYKCPNNVVDHQIVNIEFEDDIYASFTMSSFNKGGREIRIMGTKGEIRGSIDDPIITVYDFLTKQTKQIDLDATGNTITEGHGGGDYGIMVALLDVIEGRENRSACDIGESCDNHLISFAAEESRLTGKVIDMDEFSARFG